MESIGINGDLLNLIQSFLNGRTQCVSVDGVMSEWKRVTCGIPQCSVPGHILFVIFINDMPDEVKYNTCKLFADQCKLYGKVSSTEDNKMQVDLSNMEKWSKQWQLLFNAFNAKLCTLAITTQNTLTTSTSIF